MLNRLLTLLLVWMWLQPAYLLAQNEPDAPFKNAFALKAFGLSLHLRESPHPDIFPNKLDAKGYTTLNYGFISSYDRFLVRDVISVRVEQAVYADCAASLAGFTHLGWRGQIFRTGRHSLNGGFGPTLVYRRDWNAIPGYADDNYFKRHKGWQYRFYWYAGEFEYNYQLTQQFDLSISLIPGLPELVSLGAGLRYRY